MPLVQPVPFVRPQWFDANGDPVANGFLYTYAAGTNTPLATYNDHTGSTGALNPNPVQLDSGGYADVWLTSSSYKLVLQDANHNQLWSIDGVPGLGSLISVGDLPPLFTTVFSAGGLSFVLSDAAPNTLFGRFSGTTGAPSYGVIGSDKQITFNKAAAMVGSDDLIWDDTLKILSVRTGSAPVVRLMSDGGAGKILLGTGVAPFIEDHSGAGLVITSENGQDIIFGARTNGPTEYVMAANGGATGYPRGTFAMGTGSAPGSLFLNDGNQSAGVRQGPKVLGGALATPEGFVAATTGSIYLTTAGGAMTTLWVKESSPTDITGWVAK